MSHAVNHCEFVREVREAGHDKFSVKELVAKRAAEIVVERLTGKVSPRVLPGIELLALAVANEIQAAGVKAVAADLEIDMGALSQLVASDQVSYC